ncbi:class III extradiol dioxygenase subunit B-like domain-containing protein [soil metagenome]
MIVAAAVCPQPPLLIPAVAQGAAGDLAEVREACMRAITAVLSCDLDLVAIVGSGPTPGMWDESSGGSLAAYGTDVRAGGRTDDLPLSLTIGAWLLDQAGWSGARSYLVLPGNLDFVSGRVGLLVMADGTAKRSTAAPGYFDERAEGFDTYVATALSAGDTDALHSLDEALAIELWSSGVPALKALGHLTKGASLDATMHYDAAPLGVCYWVADWRVV